MTPVQRKDLRERSRKHLHLQHGFWNCGERKATERRENHVYGKPTASGTLLISFLNPYYSSFHMILVRLCSKILQARLQQYMNWELPDVQAGFRKGRGSRDQIANRCWIIEKTREFQKKKKKPASLTTLKPLTVWITINCGKFLERWEYQTTLPVSWETCMQVKKQQLEPDMEQQTGLELGKEYVKAVYCHPAYLTYM